MMITCTLLQLHTAMMVQKDSEKPIKVRKAKPLQRAYVFSKFIYNQETGDLLWNKSTNYLHIENPIVGSGRKGTGKRKYRYVNLHRQAYHVCDLVWYMHNGYLPKTPLLHLDGDILNTRIENLSHPSV
jgi:hypothetical protein